MANKHSTRFVIFDLFGTLVQFGVQHHPFRQLLKWARANGRPAHPDDARTIMTVNGNGGVDAICSQLGFTPPFELLQQTQLLIEHELSTLNLFDDVIPTLRELSNRGIRVGICSNLAQPYGAVIPTLLADFDVELFLSYELGFIKPDIQIYESIL